MTEPASATSDRLSHTGHLVVYTAVDTTKEIHRPLPSPHAGSFTTSDLLDLIPGIDSATAEVEWACRSLPPSGRDLNAWAFFVEAAPGLWVMFDDLPQELAAALLEKNFNKLAMRAIQRPFSPEVLAQAIGYGSRCGRRRLELRRVLRPNSEKSNLHGTTGEQFATYTDRDQRRVSGTAGPNAEQATALAVGSPPAAVVRRSG
jgi:hypothetical protein